MRKKGLLCKISCRLYRGYIEIRFRKGKLYPMILREDGYWWLTNIEDKKRVVVREDCASPEFIRRFFKPYQPFKKKSRYERWESNKVS